VLPPSPVPIAQTDDGKFNDAEGSAMTRERPAGSGRQKHGGAVMRRQPRIFALGKETGDREQPGKCTFIDLVRAVTAAGFSWIDTDP